MNYGPDALTLDQVIEIAARAVSRACEQADCPIMNEDADFVADAVVSAFIAKDLLREYPTKGA